MLMISDVVTRAVVRHGEGDVATIRVWMPHELARVEVWTDDPLLLGEAGNEPDYELIVLRQSADRWGSAARGARWCTWFEIDRHPAGVGAPRDREIQHA